MVYGCLATNGRIFETGECRCHGRHDFELGPTGAIRVTNDPDECIRNRIWMYMSTKKGERLDPKLGCCLHDYMHKPITGSNLKSLESDFRYELIELFPEAKVVTVNAYKLDQKSVRIAAQIDYSIVTIETNKSELMMMNDMVRQTMADLGFKSLWRSRA